MKSYSNKIEPATVAPRRALLLFTQHPLREAMHKRLGNELGRVQQLYRAFVRHLLSVAREAQSQADFDIIIASDAQDAPGFDAIFHDLKFQRPFHFLTYNGATFGEKLESAIEQSFGQDYEQLVVVGLAGRSQTHYSVGTPDDRKLPQLALPVL